MSGVTIALSLARSASTHTAKHAIKKKDFHVLKQLRCLPKKNGTSIISSPCIISASAVISTPGKARDKVMCLSVARGVTFGKKPFLLVFASKL